ncbi:MAG: hypothetical protein KJN84_06165, partial [Bacteroidia bacterium]|nr:hypothetical protein [Bacteroidia bacterium]
AILDRVKHQANNLKALSEELQLQMALGKAEARDLIEREKKNLNTFIQKQRQEINQQNTLQNDQRRTFLTCMENLESKLTEVVPEQPKAYDDYKAQVLNNVYKLEEEIKENYPQFNSALKAQLDQFKSKMDAFRVNLALHDKDDPEKVEKIRNEFTVKLDQIRQVFADKENAQSKLDSFVEDISESFSFLKKAIADLSN